MEERFKQILQNSKSWPIVNLTKNKTSFKKDVVEYSNKRILKKYESEENIYNLLIRIKNTELTAIQTNTGTYKNNSHDEAFWLNTEINLSNYENFADLIAILNSIISHYHDKIAGNFSPLHYKLAQKCVSYTLSNLLNPIQIPSLDRLNRMHEHLNNRINIEGNIFQIRELAKIGTLIILPTHFSNLDSGVISWTLHNIGLPPFIYGAGINLFNKKFWNYTLNKVGTYKIDRNKKNPVYLTTLENYSCNAIQWGCNSLFYPHGTRSRSGGIEDNLKKGLLYSALNAQARNFETNGPLGKKIFLIPTVFNYPFVLEAPLFSKNCLSSLLPDSTNVDDENDKDDENSFKIYNKLIRAKNLLTRGSYMTVRFGKPIDVLGYEVDDHGNSHNIKHDVIDTYTLVKKYIADNTYKNEEHLKLICKKILEEYDRSTTILPCHLAAYAAFFLIKEKYASPSTEELYRMDISKIIISRSSMENIFSKLVCASIYLEKEGKFFIEKKLETEELSTILANAVKNLGNYHRKRPLIFNENGDIETQDLGVLIYYSNRIKNYEHDFAKFLQ